MSKNRVITLILAVTLLALMVGSIAGQAASPRAVDGGGMPAWNPWTIKTIDAPTGADVGKHNSIAFSMETQRPYVSYYDETNGELQLAYPVDSGGNCNPNNSWYCEVVDTIDDVGQHSSVDYYFNNSTNTRKIGISYYDATNYALKIAIWSCPILTCHWHIATVQEETTLSFVGEHTSFKFDSTGTAHVSYTQYNFMSDNLIWYAYSVSSGGNCGEGDEAGKWECVSVREYTDVVDSTSLALTNSDAPWLVFYTAGSVELCNGNGSSCQIIDSGKYPSLALDSDDRPHISYYDDSTDTLMYARYVGTGGNCGSGNTTYQCDAIADIGDIPAGSISLAIDSLGYPIIAYQDASDISGIPVLNIARPITAHGQVSGNCGPSVGVIKQWQCDTLDDATQGGGGGHLYEADYVSVAVDATGIGFVSYYEYDDYNDEGRLKVVYQHRLGEAVYLPMIVK